MFLVFRVSRAMRLIPLCRLLPELEKTASSISDYALVRRQFQLFERALKKFKSDVGLWIQYIQVAKREGARSLMGRITARLVQFSSTLITFLTMHIGPSSSIPKPLHYILLPLLMNSTICPLLRRVPFFSVDFDSTQTVSICGESTCEWR